MKLEITDFDAAIETISEISDLMTDAAELHFARTGEILAGFRQDEDENESRLFPFGIPCAAVEHERVPITYSPRKAPFGSFIMKIRQRARQ